MEIIIYFLVVTVCSIGLYFYLKWFKAYVGHISIELRKHEATKDYDSIIKLRKEYRRKDYLTSVIISIFILIVLIPLCVYFRSIFDDKFNICVGINTVGLMLAGFITSAKVWGNRYKKDGQNPNRLKNGSFVIYLRAFNDDNTPWSSEEQIVKAFVKKLPVYKIGKPNDIELGESDVIKFYETDMSWKEQISLAKNKSKYIIISLNGTNGLIWEYLDTIKYKEKILYVVERKESFTQFCIRYKQYTSFPFNFPIPLQQSYPCFFWFKGSDVEIHSLNDSNSIKGIVKLFMKTKNS